jgi:hypothetical protein
MIFNGQYWFLSAIRTTLCWFKKSWKSTTQYWFSQNHIAFKIMKLSSSTIGCVLPEMISYTVTVRSNSRALFRADCNQIGVTCITVLLSGPPCLTCTGISSVLIWTGAIILTWIVQTFVHICIISSNMNRESIRFIVYKLNIFKLLWGKENTMQ